MSSFSLIKNLMCPFPAVILFWHQLKSSHLLSLFFIRNLE